MAFWGVEVEPGKPYVHQYDDERGRLHVSQATIVAGSSNKRSVVQCNIGDNKPIYLCSLLPEKIETQALNLEFEEDDEVTFSVLGPHPVHLSGFFYGDNEDQDNCCDDHDSDSYGEDVMMIESGDEGDSIDYDSGDDDEDDEFSLYPSQVPNSGVIIEEIVDEEKPKQAKKKRSQLGTSNENEKSRQMVVKSGTGVPLLESEDEDGFPLSLQESKTDTLKSGSKAEERDNESTGLKKQKKKEKDTSDGKKLKRKIDAVSQDIEPTRDNNEPHDSSVQPDTAAPVSKTKQKKNKKKKVAEEVENAQESGLLNSTSNGESPVAINDLKQTADKKNKKHNKQQESAATPNTEEKLAGKKVTFVEKKEKPKAQVRTFSNGLVIEELAMGKPDGKRASPGKKVNVRYIGKLKKNDKIFDSNIGKAPFKFRLGIGEVIKGWDVGVNGMRVGDKRRLTIPPAMGYGAKGCPPAIPQNSWLVFDVELVDVN